MIQQFIHLIRIFICQCIRGIGLVFAFLVGIALSPCIHAQSFSFGLWGDMPYAKANDAPRIAPLIADMNASDIAFSIYDGDIKDGSSKCGDEVYSEAVKMFNSLKKPAVYVPGDNEWTDCHRVNNGGYDAMERLDHIRREMFSSGRSFGKEKMRLEQQGKPGEKFAENVRFTRRQIVFAGLNVPGTNNNKVSSDKECTDKSARTLDQCKAYNAEYLERDAANMLWIQETFRLAKQKKARGVVLAIQADPGFDLPETEKFNERSLPEFDGYTNLLNALIGETRAFRGQVLLVHGGTHFFKLDKPLLRQDDLLQNFTRLQTFGSPNIHWVKVTVDPKTRALFTIHPMIVEGN
jgi:hypothetical protein